MMDLQRFAGEKSMPATPRRRQRARQHGQVAHSSDLASAASFLATAAAVIAFGPRVAGAFANWAANLWSEPANALYTTQGPVAILGSGAHVVQSFVLVVGLCGAGAAVAAGVSQTGFVFSTDSVVPQLGRINPLSGAQRLVSRESLISLGRSLLKMVLIAAVAVNPVRTLIARIGGSGSAVQVAGWTLQTARTLVLRSAVVFLVIGAADFLYQRWSNDQKLRMTSEEAKQEVKEDEGDPRLRGLRRRRQRELSRRRMLLDVRRADVVITNPTHVAVALRYDQSTMSAPVVLAKGSGYQAERIRALARLHGVMIVENPPLARSLHHAVAVGKHIPSSLYQAVAEVLAFVWRVRGQL